MLEILFDDGARRAWRCAICQQTSGPPAPASRWIHYCNGPRRDVMSAPCLHQGEPTGESFRCRGCPGSPRVHALFGCALHGACLPLASATGVVCCAACPDYVAAPIG